MPERNWSLIQLKDGRRLEPVALGSGVSTVGREANCTLRLIDPSISRQHAEFVQLDNELQVRDLNSRNGVRVNGVPRKQAALQPGDKIEIGALTFELAATPGLPSLRSSLLENTQVQSELQQTAKHQTSLPEVSGERQLSTLYHVCFWLAEDLDQTAFADKCLHLLQEGLKAKETQFYNAARQLEKWSSDDSEKPVIRLANFLAARFQNASESICIFGRDIKKHQQNVGDFNYLISPIRSPQASNATENPFVVIIRPITWEDFSTQDRVLLQAVSQLWLRAMNRARQIEALRTENATLKQSRQAPQLLGVSPAIEKLRQQAVKAARTKATTFIHGETGSGKEVVSHFIHLNSPRKEAPFIKVNCAAIPDGLIESELFGHVKGAFTDARADRRGKFEQAHGGTLFLDEVGEMPLSVQSKLLRAIENGEIEKLGSEKVVQVDVRLIAASHRDLAQMVQSRQFREDLFYRLSVLTVRVPPLREHLEDFEILADHFLGRFCEENGMATLKFSTEAIELLKQHDWPGNVRELRNVVQRCAVNTEEPFISARIVSEEMGQKNL